MVGHAHRQDIMPYITRDLTRRFALPGCAKPCGNRRGRSTSLARLRGEIRAYNLAELRRIMEYTQQEVARQMGIRQSGVSRLESDAHTDVKLSTLRAYVEALGGRIEMTAHFDDQEPLPIGL